MQDDNQPRNPYQTPSASLSAPLSDAPSPMQLKDIANGQKILIYTIVANFLVTGLAKNLNETGVIMVFALLITGAALYGTYRITTGLGYSLLIKVVALLCMFVPLLSLVAMLVLSSRATKQLRAAGVAVGFFGAK